MKQSPELQKIQEAMRPGRLTKTGFLGSDSRPLADILAEDEATVTRLGLTHAAIATRMAYFREKGEAGLGLAVDVPPHFEVRVDGVRGRLPCPFAHPGLYPKIFCQVHNQKTGETVTYSDLQIHLIGDHGFYEGRGSPYRLEPETLVQVLEITPEE
jgi:hypothetical protein